MIETEDIESWRFPQIQQAEPKTDVERLERCLTLIRERSPPSAEYLLECLRAVEPEERIAQLKNHNQLGSPMHVISSSGQTKLLQCVIDCVETATDRYDIARLPDDCGVTAMHHAARNSQPQIISMFMKSMVEEDRLDLLEKRDSAGYTVLDGAVLNDTLNVEVAEAILLHLNPVQRKKLIDASLSYINASSRLEEDVRASGAGIDMNIVDEGEARHDDLLQEREFQVDTEHSKRPTVDMCTQTAGSELTKLWQVIGALQNRVTTLEQQHDGTCKELLVVKEQLREESEKRRELQDRFEKDQHWRFQNMGTGQLETLSISDSTSSDHSGSTGRAEEAMESDMSSLGSDT